MFFDQLIGSNGANWTDDLALVVEKANDTFEWSLGFNGMQNSTLIAFETTKDIANSSMETSTHLGGIAYFLSYLGIYLPYVLFSGFGVVVGIIGISHKL